MWRGGLSWAAQISYFLSVLKAYFSKFGPPHPDCHTRLPLASSGLSPMLLNETPRHSSPSHSRFLSMHRCLCWCTLSAMRQTTHTFTCIHALLHPDVCNTHTCRCPRDLTRPRSLRPKRANARKMLAYMQPSKPIGRDRRKTRVMVPLPTPHFDAAAQLHGAA